MKKLMVVMLIAVSATTFAQSSAIIRAGLNFANVSINDDGDIDDAKSLTSFQAGIIGDVRITSFLSFQPGLLFTGKGSKTQIGTEGQIGYSKATTNPYYIEIPANLVLKSSGPVRFFAGAGPYLGIGIAGKTKIEGRTLAGTYEIEEDIVWSDDDPTTLDYEEGAGFGVMKRFDYGINGTAGIEFTKAVLSVNYGHGLAKLQSGANSSADNNNKHRVFSVTVGIKL